MIIWSYFYSFFPGKSEFVSEGVIHSKKSLIYKWKVGLLLGIGMGTQTFLKPHSSRRFDFFKLQWLVEDSKRSTLSDSYFCLVENYLIIEPMLASNGCCFSKNITLFISLAHITYRRYGPKDITCLNAAKVFQNLACERKSILRTWTIWVFLI